MSGLDYLLHPDNLTAATYCTAYPCGLGVAEPTTMITDYILTIELFILAAVLIRFGWFASPRWARYWAVGFVFLGVSFAFGGSEHGFAIPLKCTGRDACIGSSWLWVATLLTQTPGLALPVIGTVYLIKGAESSSAIMAAIIYASVLVVVQSGTALLGALSTPLEGFLISFVAVILFALPSVIIVLTLLSLPVCCCRTAPPATGQSTTLVGWVICMISLAWQATGIGFHEHFNHNDIFHTIFMVGLAITTFGLSKQLTASIGIEGEPLSPKKGVGSV